MKAEREGKKYMLGWGHGRYLRPMGTHEQGQPWAVIRAPQEVLGQSSTKSPRVSRGSAGQPSTKVEKQGKS